MGKGNREWPRRSPFSSCCFVWSGRANIWADDIACGISSFTVPYRCPNTFTNASIIPFIPFPNCQRYYCPAKCRLYVRRFADRHC